MSDSAKSITCPRCEHRIQIDHLKPKGRTVSLSGRQYEAAMIAIQGAPSKDGAIELGTTEQCFKNYMREVYNQTGTANRTRLAYLVLTGRIVLVRRGSRP